MDNSNSKNMHNNYNQVILFSVKEFLREQKRSSGCLAIMPKRVQETDKTNSVPTKIQHLLKECREIVVDDLPTRLPPLRSISH